MLCKMYLPNRTLLRLKKGHLPFFFLAQKFIFGRHFLRNSGDLMCLVTNIEQISKDLL